MIAVHRTESMGRKTRSTLAQSGRLESQRISGGGRSVFLDFSFYRTSQDLDDAPHQRTLISVISAACFLFYLDWLVEHKKRLENPTSYHVFAPIVGIRRT